MLWIDCDSQSICVLIELCVYRLCVCLFVWVCICMDAPNKRPMVIEIDAQSTRFPITQRERESQQQNGNTNFETNSKCALNGISIKLENDAWKVEHCVCVKCHRGPFYNLYTFLWSMLLWLCKQFTERNVCICVFECGFFYSITIELKSNEWACDFVTLDFSICYAINCWGISAKIVWNRRMATKATEFGRNHLMAYMYTIRYIFAEIKRSFV